MDIRQTRPNFVFMPQERIIKDAAKDAAKDDVVDAEFTEVDDDKNNKKSA